LTELKAKLLTTELKDAVLYAESTLLWFVVGRLCMDLMEEAMVG
jgi:hypothetical protein